MKARVVDAYGVVNAADVVDDKTARQRLETRFKVAELMAVGLQLHVPAKRIDTRGDGLQ